MGNFPADFYLRNFHAMSWCGPAVGACRCSFPRMYGSDPAQSEFCRPCSARLVYARTLLLPGATCYVPAIIPHYNGGGLAIYKCAATPGAVSALGIAQEAGPDVARHRADQPFTGQTYVGLE